MKMVAMPINPAYPISEYNKHATMIANNGAIQIEFIFKFIYSNRLTSFDSRFTTLPGDVSPSAHCDKRNACNQKSNIVKLIIIINAGNSAYKMD